MIKGRYFLIYCLLAILFEGCSNPSSENQDVFKIDSGELMFLDSISIDEEGAAFNFVFNPKIYQDTLLVFGDGSFSAIHLYNLKSGSKIQTYSFWETQDFPLPKTGFSNAFIESDSVFLLNRTTDKIYILNPEAKFLGQVELTNRPLGSRLNFQPFFERINGNYFVSLRYEGDLVECFGKGRLLAKFSRNGEYLGRFGKYPKNYSEGNLALVRGENVVRKGDKIFAQNSVGYPVLKEFTERGGLVDSIKIPSDHFDSKLSYFVDNWWETDSMDEILCISTDSNKEDSIFYFTYMHFESEELENKASSFRLMLLKADLKSKTIKETELLGPWHYTELRAMIPQVKNDTLSLLVRGFDENLYLKHFLFD